MKTGRRALTATGATLGLSEGMLQATVSSGDSRLSRAVDTVQQASLTLLEIC